MNLFEWVLIPLLCLCALQTVRARLLLTSALWLAGASACLSIFLYVLGAHVVAVVELSVGAGLVTVLFVFAIGMAGEEALGARAAVPVPLAAMLAALGMVLLALMLFASQPAQPPQSAPAFADVFWQARALDLPLMLVLIFAAALGIVSLLAEDDAGYVMPDLRARVPHRMGIETAPPRTEEVPP